MIIHTEAIRGGEEEEVINLLNQVFGGWPHYEIKCSRKEYWDWKYRKNPLKKEQIIVAKKDDLIVGCFHRIPAKAKIGSRIYLTSAGTDVAVHPDYRKKGIYNQMQDDIYLLAEQVGVVFLWGITGNSILVSKGLREKYGELPHPCHIYARIDDLGKHIKNTGKIPVTERVGFTVLKHLSRLKNALNKRDNLHLSLKVEEIEEYDSSINNFWEKIKEEYKFILERTRDYMNWRYCESDVIKYRNMIATENGEPQGFAVIKIDEKNPYYKKGYVVDLLAYRSSETVYSLLMKKITEYMKREKVNFVCFKQVETPPLDKKLGRYGFLNTRREVFFQYPRDHLYIGDDEKQFNESKPEEIHFRYGDGDWI